MLLNHNRRNAERYQKESTNDWVNSVFGRDKGKQKTHDEGKDQGKQTIDKLSEEQK